MTRTLLGTALLTLSLAPAAAAQGEVILLWNECRAKGGTTGVDFNCATDEDLHSPVVSFTVPATVTGVVGFEARLGLSTTPPCDGPGPCDGPVMSEWRNLQLGG